MNNMAQHVPLYSIPFYRCYVQEHAQIQELIPMERVRELTAFSSPWRCNVKISRDSVEINEMNLPDQWQNEFYKICGKYFKEFVKMTYNLNSNVQITFFDSWINLYEKNAFQEWHNHLSPKSMFSFCYFYKIPENISSGKFLFKSRLNELECNFPQQFKTQNTISPEEKQNELFIFPSWLDHMVTPHNCEEERVTFSGNFYLT